MMDHLIFYTVLHNTGHFQADLDSKKLNLQSAYFFMIWDLKNILSSQLIL